MPIKLSAATPQRSRSDRGDPNRLAQLAAFPRSGIPLVSWNKGPA
ncbi:hypothetical protein [Arthrobacter gallicola]|nr:hypothetical protein [Arthrobacter gallicola]